MDKEEKKLLLTDNTKTDEEIGDILGLSKKYIPILRKRWGISSKKRGRKTGTLAKTTSFGRCIECHKEIKLIKSCEKKYCSRKCMYSSNSYINKLKKVNKDYMQTEAYKQTLMKNTTKEYRRYCNRVHKLTHKTYQENMDILNPLGKSRTVCGVDGGYQIDHIIPLKHGFENNISPETMSQLENLRLVPWKENLLKGSILIKD